MTSVSSAVYTITVSGITGHGTLGLNLIDDHSIRDLAGNPLTTAGYPVSFSNQTTVSTGLNPGQVVSADLNSDGKMDLVVVNSNNNTVSIVLGNGDGTYASQRTYSVGANPTAVSVGDLNGDGKNDIVVTGYSSSSTASILMGNGNGTFQPQKTIATGSYPTSIAIGDLNNDGKPDLVVTNESSCFISLFKGNGDGTFAPQQALTSVNSYSLESVKIVDLNHDSQADLMVLNDDANKLSIFLGNGNLSFSAERTIATGYYPMQFAIGDLNRDGNLDIAVANHLGGDVTILTGNGDGTFAGHPTIAMGGLIQSLAITDMNSDGQNDLMVVNGQTVSILTGNGDAALNSAQTLTAGTNPQGLTVSGLNRDGKVDIAVTNASDNTVSLLINNTSGDFTGQFYTIDTTPAITTSPVSVTINVGGTATFTAAATGYPAPTVQWQTSTDNGQTWSAIANATSGTYSIVATAANLGSQYRAVFTNVISGVTATVTTSAGTIYSKPAITTEPTSVTVNYGTTATFTSAATGSPVLTVQWQKSTDNGASWNNITGATSNTYTTPATVTANDQTQYRAVYNHAISGITYTATTVAATLFVITPPAMISQSASLTVLAGTVAKFSAAASGTKLLTIQWQVSTNNGVAWVCIAGANTTEYSFIAALSDSGKQYHAVFTNPAGSATTAAATLTVGVVFVMTSQPLNVATVAGSSVSFTASASGTPTPTVLWEWSVDGKAWNTTGVTSTTYTFSPTLGDNGKQYHVFGDNYPSALTTIRIPGVAGGNFLLPGGGQNGRRP